MDRFIRPNSNEAASCSGLMAILLQSGRYSGDEVNEKETDDETPSTGCKPKALRV
jgi:hypothetical protein